MVMWAHYADNYKGFCCEFEFDYYDVGTTLDIKGTSNIFNHFHKITYTKKFPIIDVKKLLDYSPDNLKNSKYIYRFVEKTLKLKHKQWAYEREFRLIIHKNSKFFKKIFDKNDCGFKISFPYLKALYISFEKCIDETSIIDIATTHKIKYFGLVPSISGVELVEDAKHINIHNIMLDSERILNSFSPQKSQQEDIPF